MGARRAAGLLFILAALAAAPVHARPGDELMMALPLPPKGWAIANMKVGRTRYREPMAEIQYRTSGGQAYVRVVSSDRPPLADPEAAVKTDAFLKRNRATVLKVGAQKLVLFTLRQAWYVMGVAGPRNTVQIYVLHQRARDRGRSAAIDLARRIDWATLATVRALP